ncbi:hypothetical protein BDZ88DRAFT_420693 [Geranomyces variabilis]|nr:hypothetical protein BDZ88DRAFT_420693 [Geranomyces variabilis]
MEMSPRAHTYKLIGKIGAVASVAFLVLSADWGEGEHCFSGVRRWADEQRRGWFELTPEDERELRAAGKIIPPKPPSEVARTTSSTSSFFTK